MPRRRNRPVVTILCKALALAFLAKLRFTTARIAKAMEDRTTTSRRATYAGFDKTQWTQVLVAINQQLPGSEEALNDLCRKYRDPLYTFIRAQGRNREQAEDLVQEFLVRLLAKDRLSKVSPAKGRFRNFLLACLTNFLHNQRDKENAQKRGGGRKRVAIKPSDTQTGTGVVLQDPLTPDRMFDREWAATLIREVVEALRRKYHESGRGKKFETLHPLLADQRQHGISIEEAAVKLGLTENAVRQALHHLRQDYRELLRAEVGRTVETSSEVEEELRYLLCAFQT